MDNPYWHPYYKPHAIDFDEVRDLCFDAYSIIAASHAIAGLPGDEVGGPLHEYFLRTAEARLSDCLLTIAVRMRTFEDILSDEAKSEYDKVVLEHTGNGELGSIGWNDSSDRVDLTFREACNKIIHTKDFRPTYDNDSNDREENYAWGMTGIVELMGKFGKREWDVWLTAEEFLSACLHIANVVDPLPTEDEETAERE
ncbi:hypothetical protein ACC755_21295 [Rhizobium ruizarguesonis]|uniref:hypothetical protein n=1 Tax=Rhizobium TaxID=379 RepID=UPI0010309913|nr:MULTISPECIES: hypothetical protein [Rhizobium]MBY2941422.1 hypothetical protein [Rhizobium leguminosarum]TAY93612.1 hypothetical protein ELH85_10735 [Rhizobium ruizarguesonis]